MLRSHSISARFAAALIASSPFLATSAVAQDAASATTAPFTLPELPYATDALAPVIDAQTMELHHGKHHQSYVDNLNAAVESDAALAGLTLEEMVAAAGTLPNAVRNNAGGHWNHSFFWELMAPEGERGEPTPELTDAINAAFGSVDEFKQAFAAAGAARFGSGWVWLVVNENDELAITSTPNQDNPLMDVAETRGVPVIGNDVWEHAYYLTYNNRRPEYLGAWWDVVDWEQVSDTYTEALDR